MVRMPESRPYHHGDLRSALLAGAERTLREKGTGALSLRELAREAGVSHAAPGRHFKDKQALLNALALAGYDRLGQALDSADDATLPLERRLTALARSYLAFAIDNAELLELMYARKHEPDASEQMAAAVDRTVGSLERVIADAQERGEIIAGDPQHLTLLTGATLQGIASFAAGGMLAPEAALDGIEELVHLLLHGLKPR
ncbi:TetR/AcrR family transcriptional regulator [Streptomyces purpurascens]|uniref:TetR/AcrR family transcriptional regulator n=1 Tax=Streptomyces purpurascens TaxID=1924 RepID=UPI001679B075|nr:TetR/AcrR family transcriptional regulator [Streptomyces purpurascens]MCE7051067.1 TetR/AcrR family transcriptional regulator [Streptomyces purpurascens]GHA53603.1 TetR family transcriptional regulator [Streptomyces purpurascens]